MATGTLTNIGQHDWIAVSLTANQAYEFTIVGAGAEIAMASDLSGDGTSAFSIAATSVGISPSGTQFMYFMPSVSGTYYIDVSDTFGDGAGQLYRQRRRCDRRLHRQSYPSGSNYGGNSTASRLRLQRRRQIRHPLSEQQWGS